MQFFEPEEFSCGDNCGAGFDDMNPDTLAMLDEARLIAGTPFNITSAYRCEDHNYRVGGRDNSAHTKGYAVDIEAESSSQKFDIVRGLIIAGFNRIGVYADFIHVDNDPSKPGQVMWHG